jgi:hypothetical protein
VAAWSTCGKAMWLQKLIAELFDLELEETCIFYENQSCIKFSVNPVCHDKSKNIEIKVPLYTSDDTKGRSKAPICSY